MNLYNMIMNNIGIPTVVYYVVALVVITFLEHDIQNNLEFCIEKIMDMCLAKNVTQ